MGQPGERAPDKARVGFSTFHSEMRFGTSPWIPLVYESLQLAVCSRLAVSGIKFHPLTKLQIMNQALHKPISSNFTVEPLVTGRFLYRNIQTLAVPETFLPNSRGP